MYNHLIFYILFKNWTAGWKSIWFRVHIEIPGWNWLWILPFCQTKFSIEVSSTLSLSSMNWITNKIIIIRSISVQGVGVSFTDLSQHENGGSKYCFTWSSTKIEPNKKKDRTKLPLLLQFQDGISLSLPLQVKFYKEEDTQHVTWGTPLHQIDYECTLKPGATYVDISKEVFR